MKSKKVKKKMSKTTKPAKSLPKKEPKTEKRAEISPKVDIEAFQRPKGTRDFMPNEMERRRTVFENLRNVFQRYGYGEVSTPAFESLELLTAKGSLGDEAVKDIYRFTDKSERQLGLRYDPTTPLARIIASSPDMPKPIRWYYMTNMWRYEDTSAGRHREFWQAGIELVGSTSQAADGEALQIMIESLLAAGLDDFVIRVNSRKILDSIAGKMKIKNPEQVFRIIDKMDRKDERSIKEELKAIGIEPKKITELMKTVKTDASKMRSISGVKDLEKTLELLDDKARKYVKIDFSIVRGLDYYTGMVFETYAKGHESLGSIASGGRYDTLIERYGGKPTPAIGFGIGIDRLVPILEEKAILKTPKKKIVLVAPVNDEVIKTSFEIARSIRSKNSIVEMGFPEKSLSKLLEYAGKKNIIFTVIVGPNDLKEGLVTLRDMASGEEKRVSMNLIADEIRDWERNKLFY
jgi:histidyl-tRNA synthetase